MSAAEDVRRLESIDDAMLDPAPPFVEVSLGDLSESSIVPQRWYWHEYVPAGHVTLLAGHGGVGKSTFALMLAASIAAGAEFLGVRTTKARVAYFSAEDPGEVVRARLARVCAELELPSNAVQSNLMVLDATDGDPVLFAQRRGQAAEPTLTFEKLASELSGRGVEVVVIDNASEVFSASEIDRTQVAGFVRSLRKLGKAALLVSHVDKAAAKHRGGGAESYSGSTAWHNSVRSRLLLVEPKRGILELRHEKSNFGKPRDRLFLARTGAGGLIGFAPDDQGDGAGSAFAPNNDDITLVLLKLIYDYLGRGESIATTANGPYNPEKMLSREKSYPAGLTAGDATQHMRDAERDGMAFRERYKTDGRKNRDRWALTPKGLEFIGVAPSAPSAPSTNENELVAVGAGSTGAIAPSAPSARGGCGGRARTQHGAQRAKKKATATSSGRAPSSNVGDRTPTLSAAFNVPAGLAATTAAPAAAPAELEPA